MNVDGDGRDVWKDGVRKNCGRESCEHTFCASRMIGERAFNQLDSTNACIVW